MKDCKSLEATKKITRCAIYTRVSTDQQAEVAFNSCEAQEDKVRSFVASQEGFEVQKVYSDPGYTGANMDRPGLRAMLRDIQDGKLDLVITYKIDRLTRSPRDFYQLIELFEARNVSFISVTERFDTSTPSGRLLRNIMLTFAQFERELASERIRDKFSQRAQRGLYNGGRPPLGYKRENGKLAPIKAEVEAVRMDTYVQSRSIRAVQNLFQEKKVLSRRGTILTDSFIWRVLRNPVYTGKVPYKGALHPGQHAAIISQELFDYVQKLLAEEPRRKAKPYEHLPYAGLIQCRECGSHMSPVHTNKVNTDGPRKYYYYRCTKLNHRGWAACSTRQISAERFHDIMRKNMIRLSMDMESLKNLIFALKHQTRSLGSEGIEPEAKYPGLTPENLQKALKEYLKNCARGTGMEETLAVRRSVKGIIYSKDTISVEFFYTRPPDGKSLAEEPSSPSARSAENFLGRPARRQQKGPGRCARPDPLVQFDTERM